MAVSDPGRGCALNPQPFQSTTLKCFQIFNQLRSNVFKPQTCESNTTQNFRFLGSPAQRLSDRSRYDRAKPSEHPRHRICQQRVVLLLYCHCGEGVLFVGWRQRGSSVLSFFFSSFLSLLSPERSPPSTRGTESVDRQNLSIEDLLYRWNANAKPSEHPRHRIC